MWSVCVSKFLAKLYGKKKHTPIFPKKDGWGKSMIVQGELFRDHQILSSPCQHIFALMFYCPSPSSSASAPQIGTSSGLVEVQPMFLYWPLILSVSFWAIGALEKKEQRLIWLVSLDLIWKWKLEIEKAEIASD